MTQEAPPPPHQEPKRFELENVRKQNVSNVLNGLYAKCELNEMIESVSTNDILRQMMKIYPLFDSSDVVAAMELNGFATCSFLGDASWLVKPLF